MLEIGKMKKNGCLIIHGLTGTPATMKPLVDSLSAAGFEVNAPLLSGHGSKVGDLVGVKWQNWREDILGAYTELSRSVSNVHLIGLSMGGLLAIKIAAEKGHNIQSLVLISTPLVLNPFVELVAYPMVKWTPLKWVYRYNKKNWTDSVAEAGGREFCVNHSYDRIPVCSIMEMFKLKKIAKKQLGKIKSPALIIHSEQDSTAPLKNVLILENGIKTGMVEKMILKRSKHVVTLDYDKNEVAGKVASFLRKFS